MNPQVLHDYIIYPTLEHMGSKYNTKPARMLLMMTAAQESHCGTYFKQVGKGPALGIYQMEPATIQDLHENFLKYNMELTATLSGLQSAAGRSNEVLSVLGNTFYATALARANYFRFSEPLPTSNDPYDLWKYYKKYWNTEQGAATEGEFMLNYHGYVRNVSFEAPR